MSFAFDKAKRLVYNFGSFGPLMFRSGQPATREEWEALKDVGVKRVLSLNGSRDEIALDLGLPVTNLTIGDDEAQTALRDPAVLERIDAALMSSCVDGSDCGWLVHCTEGKDRTGIAVARYRVLTDRWTKEAAKAEWDLYGSHQYAGLIAAWNAWKPGVLRMRSDRVWTYDEWHSRTM